VPGEALFYRDLRPSAVSREILLAKVRMRQGIHVAAEPPGRLSAQDRLATDTTSVVTAGVRSMVWPNRGGHGHRKNFTGFAGLRPW